MGGFGIDGPLSTALGAAIACPDKTTFIAVSYTHLPELQQRILQAELDTVEENLEVLRQQGKNVSRAMLKGLEKRKHNLEAKLEKVEHAIKSRTDDVVRCV